MNGSRENLASTGVGTSVLSFLFVFPSMMQCGAMLFCGGTSRLATASYQSGTSQNGFIMALVNYQSGTNLEWYK